MKFSYLIGLISIISINLLNLNKFYDRCEEMLTCDSCINLTSLCGWCYGDGKCKQGNHISPSNGFCNYTQWEITRCKTIDCKTIKNTLACITQNDCAWCEGDKQCIDKPSKNEITNCPKLTLLDDYIKTPKLFNKHLSTFNQTSEFVNPNINNLEPLNEMFSLYDSFNNPAGVFVSQLPLNNKKRITSCTNVTIDEHEHIVNSEEMKKQLIKLSENELESNISDLAMDKLKPMFNLKNNTNIKITKEFEGSRYYLILESLAGDKWLSYLNKTNVEKESLHKIINLTEHINLNLTALSQKYKKLSLTYPLNYKDKHIRQTYSWLSLPGSYVKLYTFLPSTVIILQKIKLYGSGKNLQSVFIHRDLIDRALKVDREGRQINKIDINNMIISNNEPSIHTYMAAYKSDFIVDNKNPLNQILSNTIEFPYSIETKSITSEFSVPSLKLDWFDIDELSLKVNITSKSIYMMVYKLYIENKKKNMIFKLNVEKDILGSTSLSLPTSTRVSNIAGIGFITLDKGDHEILIKGKVISQNISLLSPSFRKVVNDEDIKPSNKKADNHNPQKWNITNIDVVGNNTDTLNDTITQNMIEKDMDIIYEDFFDKMKKDEVRLTFKNDFDSFINSNQVTHKATNFGELTVLKLPITSEVYSLGLKGLIEFKSNSEYTKILSKTFTIAGEKNVLIYTNIILDLSVASTMDFKIQINKVDDCDSYMNTEHEHFVYLNSFIINKFKPGSYEVELLFKIDKGVNHLIDNDEGDSLSINILLLDI
jgi:hypothetical protein